MTFKQLLPITTKLRGPFMLTKIPVSLAAKCTRKRFACGYKAVAELRSLKLNPAKYYGAEVSDDTGAIVAELE